MTTTTRVAVPVMALLMIVTLTHLGIRTGCYGSSRPDREPGLYTLHWDGAIAPGVFEGVPTQADALHAFRLKGLFMGASGEASSGIQDFRPLPSFLQACSEWSGVGAYFGGVFINLLAFAAAGWCAVDLARLMDRPPAVALAFAALVVTGRGVGFYVGAPDAHAMGIALFPVGIWACERLGASGPVAPRWGALTAGLIIGVALLTFGANAALLVYLWLRGIGRAPLLRLIGVSGVALGILGGWRWVGQTAGLSFDPFTDQWVGKGLSAMAGEVHDVVAEAWLWPAPGSGLRGWLGAAITMLRWRLSLPHRTIHSLVDSLVPAFGGPLLAAALAGFLFAARRTDRWVAAALVVPPLLLAWPMLYHWDAPRLMYTGWLGLAWLAALGLASLHEWTWRLCLVAGLKPAPAARLAKLLFLGLLGAMVCHENADVLGDMDAMNAFHFGAPARLYAGF